MAPEYIGGKPYTERSDLFAVGMTLYEMVTGRPAVTGKDPYQILHQVRISRLHRHRSSIRRSTSDWTT
jgi:serine/threonine protein kinase